MEGNDQPAPKRRVRVPFIAAAPLLLLGAGTAQILGGEVIPVGGGVGWDGRFYAEVAADLPAALAAGSIDGYRFRRLLPSALAWLTLRALGLPPDAGHAREVFAWLNLALQMVTLAAWTGVARRAGLGEGGLWLGFVLLFLNFANAKMPFYYSPLTDTAAQALGAALLYFHVARQPTLILLVLALGAFTWPSFLAFGAFFFVYPPGEAGQAPRAPAWWRTALASSAAIAFVALALVHRGDVARQGGSVVAAALALAYLWRIVGDLAGADTTAPSILLARTALARWGVVAVLAAGVWLVPRALGAPAQFDTGYFLRHLAIFSLARPGGFLVAHASYFGLVVPILIVFWPQVVGAAHRLGTGLTLFVLAHLVWGLHSESRQLVDGLPALVLLATLAASTVRWPRGTVPIATGMALVASKVWLPINHDGFIGRSNPASYPAQHYFMHHGPWMAGGPYRAQAAALATACALLWLARRRLHPVEGSETSIPPVEVPPGVVRAAAILTVAAAVLGLVEAGARLGVRPKPPAADPVPAIAEARGRDQRGPGTIGRAPVLLLGDEFLGESGSVPADAHVRTALERALAAGGAPRAVVIAARSQAGTAEEERLFRCRRTHEPSVVVLFFRSNDLLENDAEEREVGCEEDEPREVPAAGLRTSAVLPFRGSVALRLFGEWAVVHAAPAHRWMERWGLAERASPPAWLWPYGQVPEARPWWDRSEAQLRRLAAEVSPGRLVVFYVPEHFEVDPAAWALLTRRYEIGRRRWTPSKVAERLKDVGRRLGITVVDPREALSVAASGDAAYAADGTWTRTGHRIAARELARALSGGTDAR